MLNFAETESNKAMAAAIGRRFLALLDGAIVDFGERKNCSKGLSCGDSCISKAKVCEKLLSPEQLTLYKSLLKAKKGGDAGAEDAIDKLRQEQQGKKEKKTGIVPTPAAPEPEARKSVRDAIDDKYASDNPTKEDIDNWVKERLALQATAEQLAIDTGWNSLGVNPSAFDDATPDYLKNVSDKESWAIAKQKQERKLHEGRTEWTEADILTTPDADYEKRLKRAKDPAKKAKIQKEWDESKASTKSTIDRLNQTRDKVLNDPESRLEAARQEFDKLASARQAEANVLKKGLDGKDKVSIESLGKRLIDNLPGYEDGPRIDSKNDKVGSAAYRNAVKYHLQQLKKGPQNSPAKILSIDGELTPEKVKAAYKKAAKATHPDGGGTKAEFEAVNEAYKKLRKQLDFSDSDDAEIISFLEYQY